MGPSLFFLRIKNKLDFLNVRATHISRNSKAECLPLLMHWEVCPSSFLRTQALHNLNRAVLLRGQRQVLRRPDPGLHRDGRLGPQPHGRLHVWHQHVHPHHRANLLFQVGRRVLQAVYAGGIWIPAGIGSAR